MTAHELLKAGRLGEAIQVLTEQVKSKPADLGLRVFLFELLSYDGALDRAERQLDVVATQTGGVMADLAVQVYRGLLAAERTRTQVFHGDALPKFLLTPPAYMDHYVLLVKTLHTRPVDAVAMLPAAEEAFPARPGRLADRAFSSFRDADDRVAAVLEIFHGSDYLWLPLEQVTRLQVAEPKSLRDLIWARARVETYEQSVGEVFVPALYVDTASHADDQVRLGRMTDWQAVHEQLVWGAGRRTFLLDETETSIFDLADVQFAGTAERTVNA